MNETTKDKSRHPNPALLERFLSVQEQELLMRGKELELQQQNNNNAHIYANAALQANKEDRESARNHEIKINKNRYVFCGIALICLFILIGFALYMNKDKIVMEALKAVLYFSTGGIGGYAYAKSKKDPDNSQ